MSIRPAALLLALTPVIFLLAVQPAITGALRAQLTQSDQLMTQGKLWRLADPTSMIGGKPVGQVKWHQTDAGLTLETLNSDAYVPLNFDGLRLPADALNLLTLSYDTQKITRLRFYHRAQLAGSAARSAIVELPPGQHRRIVDMTALKWSVDARPIPWGQHQGTIATLRVHPIGAGTQITLSDVSLKPAENKPAPKHQPRSLNGANWVRLTDRSFWWSTATVRQTLEDFRHSPTSWSGVEPATTSAPTSLWITQALLTALMIWSVIRRHFALALLVAAIWWCFSQPAWNGVYLACAAAALLLCVYLQTRPSPGTNNASSNGLPAIPSPELVGSKPLPDFWVALALITTLFVAMLILDGQAQTWLFRPRRWLIYLVWAALQQWVVCRVLYPLARRCGASRMLAVAGTAFIFGWAHLPNLELMVLTWLLGLACLWHYSRYQLLWAPVALHMAAGSALLLVSPLPLLYSVSAGPGFWG